MEAYWVSERRVCVVIQMARSTQRYESSRKDDPVLRSRIREIAETRVRYGYRRIHTLLRREGWHVNHKRVHRVYCEKGLNLRRKRPRRHVSGARRTGRPEAVRGDECWSMDFVCDSLFNGRRFRALTIVDNYSRACLGIEVGQSLKGGDVAGVMDRLVASRRRPDWIQCDNGSEFISKVMDKWAYDHGVTIDFSRPGGNPWPKRLWSPLTDLSGTSA